MFSTLTASLFTTGLARAPRDGEAALLSATSGFDLIRVRFGLGSDGSGSDFAGGGARFEVDATGAVATVVDMRRLLLRNVDVEMDSTADARAFDLGGISTKAPRTRLERAGAVICLSAV